MKNECKFLLKGVVILFLLYLGITYWPALTEFAGVLFHAAMPLLMGCLVAYVANILMSCYERHYFPKSSKKICVKSRRPVCMAGAFLTVVVVVFLIMRIVIPQLISCFQILFAGIPSVLNHVLDFIEKNELLPENITAMLEGIDWQSKMEQIIQMLTTGLGNVMDVVMTTVSSVVSWVVSGVLSLVFAVYLLNGKERLGKQIRKLADRYVKKQAVDKICHIISVFDESFHRFIVGQCVEAVILGVLCTIGMWILRLPYAAMIGALTAFTALIPIAGAWIGGIIGAIMILTVSPIKAVIFVIYIVVLQQIETNLVYPRVVGSSIGLPGIWVFTAVTIGGGVLGIGGMLLGVPLASGCYKLLQEDVNRPSKNCTITTKNNTNR